MPNESEQQQQKRGTIPTMDDRDRITAGEVNPRMDRTGNSDGRGGDVRSLGKFGGQGAEEASDSGVPGDSGGFGSPSAMDSGANAASAAAGEVGVDTGEDAVLYGNDVEENPNGSGRVGIKDDRS